MWYAIYAHSAWPTVHLLDIHHGSSDTPNLVVHKNGTCGATVDCPLSKLKVVHGCILQTFVRICSQRPPTPQFVMNTVYGGGGGRMLRILRYISLMRCHGNTIVN